MADPKNAKDAKKRRQAPLKTPSPLGADAVRDISAELKTKIFRDNPLKILPRITLTAEAAR